MDHRESSRVNDMNHNLILFKKYMITKDNAHNDIVIQKDENNINLRYTYTIKSIVEHEFDKFNLNQKERD